MHRGGSIFLHYIEQGLLVNAYQIIRAIVVLVAADSWAHFSVDPPQF